jgi:Nucleoside-diphosphate-sugar pyrophosphorylase involved in lipopolysaccharide biosynthesis/translation initiation factor 2B, gamma/epsilon subunits (eIF-2Bgamma/eIF-2Bepsilon)
VRENVIAGNGVVMGNSCEFKNCILFDEAQVPHFNYVGDSILGHHAHLGAGVILSNVKLITAKSLSRHPTARSQPDYENSGRLSAIGRKSVATP